MTWFMSLVDRIFPRRSIKVHVLKRDPTSLRLHEWRGDQELTNTAARALANPDIKLMLQVLDNEHPGSALVFREDVGIEPRAIQQARAEGYTMALQNLRALARFEEPPRDIEADFDEANLEQE